MYLARISSSSFVHLPFFNPTFSQHGALPILLCLREEGEAEKVRDQSCSCKKRGFFLRASPALWTVE